MQRDGAFLTPGLIEKLEEDEEHFGPLLQVIRVPNLTSAIAEANQTRYGLVASLLSDSEEEWHLFRKTVRAGLINWNCPTTGASSAAPFGGIGWSGNHRPTAQYAADICSYPVTSLVKRNVEIHTTPGVPL
ncbi:MAG: aldehyde dehydrogenase family protein [Verrucomicrobia bacterium]|nr:aldehyde dehydrogenase family protein [Verrucomicrobiota bacterium]